MSGKVGGGVGGGGGVGVGKGNIGISSIPAGSRKIVQSLKEIVNCPEPEIYAMLKDCNMDPNEAVNRLLAQDPFHEVKSKRDKKKENKDSTDFRSRGASNTSNRGGRSGADRYAGRGGSSHFGSNESGSLHSKPAYKKENGTHGYAGSTSSASSAVANNWNQRPPYHGDSVATENKMLTVGSGDGISSSSQPSSGFQSAWMGVPGQVSMADIVKMGRPQNKASAMQNSAHQSVNNRHVVAPPVASHHDLNSSYDHASKVSEINTEPEVATDPNDEWPSIEQPSTGSSVLDAPQHSELYANPSNLSVDITDQHIQSQLDEEQVEEDGSDETPGANHVASVSVSSRNIQEDNSGASSLFDNNLYNNMGSYQPQRHFEHDEAGDGTSSMTANLQQLNLQNDEQGAPPEEDNPSVIIPNHLQVHTPDCTHLSFGSFGSGIGSAFSGPFASMPLKSNLEETPEATDASSIGHSETRNPDYYGDEHLRSTSDANIVHRPTASAGDYDSPSVSQPEVLKQETPEASQENQYQFPSSAPGYTYENAQQLNAAFTHPQASSQMQNLAAFSNVMAYTNSLPSALLASTAQTAREPDLQYSPFPVAQSMPTKYNNSASSISGPTMSMPEALRASSISTPQPNPQTLPGASVATGPALPQHLAVHPYSQPTLPLGHFANMIGYPFLPQSYTYMPSAFQQTFAGNNTYHQSLAAAAVLPQYKNSVSVSSLPQSAAVPSGYGFGSSTSIPGGNFPLNTPAAAAGTTIGYDDVLSSQYKDNSHLISLQQNDNSAMWVHGPGSRTISAVPASTYYSFQGQNQQPSGFRQGQQPSQHFGALGYPNFYHSQTGMSLEHQQQNPRDGSLGSWYRASQAYYTACSHYQFPAGAQLFYTKASFSSFSIFFTFKMEEKRSDLGEDHSNSQGHKMKTQESHKKYANRDVMPRSDLWTDGLICAFEFIRGHKRSTNSKVPSRTSDVDHSKMPVPVNRQSEDSSQKLDRSKLLDSSSTDEFRSNQKSPFSDYRDSDNYQSGHLNATERFDGSHWVPIGWARISELVQTVQVDCGWASQELELMDDKDDVTVADLAAPFWERPAGPIWWCHVAAGHQAVVEWLRNAHWLHPAVSLALRDESRLISERMKYLLYEVPVRVAGGLLFELLGQSAGDPFDDEDDIPIVLRSWQAQNFLITVLHIKGPVLGNNVLGNNVLGITEVEELVFVGGYNVPRTVHEVIALLACRLSRWDDRLFRKSIFGAADEIELKFMNRRNLEDMTVFGIILNQEIRRLSRQVIRVKWSLHAREEIVFELTQHLRGNATRILLDGIRKSTREMIEEQEAVRGRLFTIQDVMQSTIRAWLQDRSLRVTHNLAVFGGGGLILSIMTGLFGINVDGIPGAESTPYAFGLFAAVLFSLGAVLIAVGLLYLGWKKPVTEAQVADKTLELQELVKKFQHEAETHAQVRKNIPRNSLPPTAGDMIPHDAEYILIQ
ncbi:hypothetical protein Q3G72_005643 [Acer saccharum]|nr:hypothetical protein Q3G72_005643 [Acer saccharum]